MSSKVVAMIVVVLVIVGGAFFLLQNNANKSATQQGVQPTQTAVSPSAAMEASPSGAVMEREEGDVKEIIVTGSSFKFVPATITVKKGDKVRIVFKNTGGMHDFVIDELDVKTEVIEGGDEEAVEFTADEAGEFEYYCSIGQHRQMGMKGKLVVEE